MIIDYGIKRQLHITLFFIHIADTSIAVLRIYIILVFIYYVRLADWFIIFINISMISKILYYQKKTLFIILKCFMC